MFYCILLLLYMTHSCVEGSGEESKGKKCGCDGYPKVPQYGLLTFTGSQYGNSDGPFRKPFNGKTAKDEDGRYFKEIKDWISSVGWVQKFELILPKDGGSYVKYTGWLGNKNCKETFPHAPGGPLFKTYNWYTYYKKIGQVEQGDSCVQRWYYKNCDNEGFCDRATYWYTCNKRTKISIPLKYSHYHQYDSADRTDEKNFVYKRFIEDESIFDVGKYCTKFY